MAEIVGGIAASHVPFMAMHPHFEMAGEGQRNRVIAGMKEAQAIVERVRPDAI